MNLTEATSIAPVNSMRSGELKAGFEVRKYKGDLLYTGTVEKHWMKESTRWTDDHDGPGIYVVQ